jgi:DNA-binding protein YbaB
MQFHGGMKEALKQIKKMQELVEQKQQELANLRVEASSGGGMVKVVANGREEIIDIEISKGGR